MNNDKTVEEKIEAFEKLMRAKHKGRMACITMRSGGFAYMRQPTRQEHDEFQSLTGTTPETNAAFARLVEACFAGAIDETGKEISLSEVELREGPAFVVAGPLGIAVNSLSGAGAAPTRFF